MNTYKFYLVKTTQWYPSVKQLKGIVVVRATDIVSARRQIAEDYPSWEISMFWNVWP